MKECSICNRTYPDNTLAFCLVDGSVLSAPYDPQATLVLPNLPSNSNVPQTQPVPSAPAKSVENLADTKQVPSGTMPQEPVIEKARGGFRLMAKFILPLVLFLVLVVFLAIGLSRDPHEIPSPLVDKPAPSFVLPQLSDPQKSFKSEEMQGKVWLLNAWASWCVACREEHALLLELSRSGVVPIYGLDYKDERPNALAWLNEFGNPYTLVISDTDGRVGIDYGVYGVPETFVIDRNGVIRYKQIGPITEDALQNKIIPLVKELQK